MMMSNTPSSLQTRQGLHRRQNSTPIAFEAMKVQYPTTVQRQNSPHRRGQSFDSRRPTRRQIQHQQSGSMVGITNMGSTPHGQQILREAQQQRIARPGQHYELPVSPQCGTYHSLQGQHTRTIPYDQMTMNAIMQNSQAMPMHSQFFHQDLNMHMSAAMPMEFDLDENNQFFPSPLPLSINVGSGSMYDRRMSHPELRLQTDIRPLTPEQYTQTAQLPLTPAATPYRAQTSRYTRSLQASPIQKMSTINIQSPHPVSMQKSRSLQGIVEQDEAATRLSNFETAEMPIPQGSIQKTISKSSNHQLELHSPRSGSETPTQGDNAPNDLCYPDKNVQARSTLNEQPVPVLTSSQTDGSQSPTRPALSPRRMSISDLNLEPGISASIEETNVTLDDIAQFIEGPDLVDNKWICKYEDCNKRFGRKENIKSHVQTHLGDRQFRCDHCNKCFVRGHDLKRHAKIHTGTKPYPCLCGNAFARHDALTRHRQRGMCIGAFDGIVKKVIKRGRPRKHRPEMDERLDKATRTRHSKTNSENGFDQYTSSASSCSLSSWGSPPTETMDNLSLRGQSPYEDLELFGMPNAFHHANQTMTFPPDMFSFTPPASPGFSTGNKPSPSYSALSDVELASLASDVPQAMTRTGSRAVSMIDELPDLEATTQLLSANPMMMQHSQQSLPGLSHSSSSPIADVAAFDFGAEDVTLSSLSSISMGFVPKSEMASSQHERNEFDSFLDFNGIEMGLDNDGVDQFFAM